MQILKQFNTNFKYKNYELEFMVPYVFQVK